MRNSGAGSTGGMAFVYDPEVHFPRLANPDSIFWQRIASAYWEDVLQALISRHVAKPEAVRA